MKEDRTNEDLLMENKLLREIIDRIHEGVLAVSDKDIIVLFNTGMEKIEGLRKREMVGKPELEAYHFLEGQSYNQVVTQQIKKYGKPLLGRVYTYNLPDGRMTNFMYNAYPFYYKNKLRAVYSIGRNMSQMEGFIAQTYEIYNQLNRGKQTNRAVYFLDDIIGKSPLMKDALGIARKVAVRSSPILMYGKTGAGKELFAQGIHNASLFSKGPFVPVNCAAIPDTLLEATLFGTSKGAFTGAIDAPGLFEQAQNGTIFLDEINSMPKPLQAKMLRVLQEKVVRRLGSIQDIKVNCRIISACNEDPFEENAIRSDLLYRIATVIISIPPLCEREGDIAELARFFIRKFNNKFGFFVQDISPSLLKGFEAYDWPGNVRELENVIETAMNLIDSNVQRLEAKHLPMYMRARMKLDQTAWEQADGEEEAGSEEMIDEDSEKLKDRLWNYEREIIEETLQKCKGNITKAADTLGIQRQNLHYRIRRFGLR